MSPHKLQVLVVEDDEDDYVHVSHLLRHCVKHASVERAPSADAALKMAGEHAPDLCFVDYRLGEHNGLEVLRELKNRDLALPVIFLTGQGDEEVAVQAMKAGAADYLLKSKLSAPSLGASVRYALTLHKKEEAVRAARRALQASEQRFRALVENSSDMILMLDAEANVLYASQSVQRVMGYVADELVEASAFEHVHPEDIARVRRAFEALLQSPGTPVETEYRMRHKDGSWRVVESTAMNRLHEAPVDAVVVNQRDISQRKKAQEELRESAERYRLLFERNLAGVFHTSAEGKILSANDSLARMLGYDSREELLGRDMAEFCSGPEESERLLRELDARGHVVTYELNVRRKDGGEGCLLMSSTVLCDKQGSHMGTEGTLLDVTERRALQQQLLHSQKMDAVGQLAGGVAHDFNNLLMVISSYAELLSAAIGDNPKAQQQAEEILKAARRAAGLTRQLLAFSRKQVMSPRMLDLNSVLAELGRMLPRLIGEDIQVVLNPGPSLWKVKADPGQIEQVIINLALNARDAMPRGGKLLLETSNVELDGAYTRRHLAVPPGEYVLLAVSDTGCGIPPEILPHIFEPFFTTKELGKGTGLGLPTVYGIVKQSGGHVWVYSEAGQGTVFKVYLPRADANPEPVAEEHPIARQLKGSETVLVVEDEDAVREAVGEYLASRGYTVLQGKNGGDALQVLQHYGGPVHLLITDVVMPGLSGAELARKVAELRPGIPVLYISGYTEGMVVQHGVEAGSGFLQKPFTLCAIGEKVREVLDSAKSSPHPETAGATADRA